LVFYFKRRKHFDLSDLHVSVNFGFNLNRYKLFST